MPPLSRCSAVALAWAAALAFLVPSCKDYPYESPEAGVLEIRLAVKNSRDLLPFSEYSAFILVLNDVQALQPGSVKLRVYSDLTAIRRYPEILNALNPSARDSVPILGKVYAPPGVYSELEVRMEFTDTIYTLSPEGGFVNRLPVVWPPFTVPTDLNVISGLSITVEEARTTRVVVTLDLDQTLVRKPEEFELHPTFYVSSIATL